jgi:hypothetical protein
MIAVKAHFDGQFIVPDEPLDLRKGQKLVVRIEPVGRVRKSSRKPGGRKKTALDRIAELRVSDDSLPADLSYQHDHYLYGTPKKPEPKR